MKRMSPRAHLRIDESVRAANAKTGDVNVMDQSPFYVLNLDGLDAGLEVLARFHKSVLSPEAIRDYATELNYTAKMVQFLRAELDLRDREPSENLVRWILAGERMYEGRVTGNVVDRFCPIARSALLREDSRGAHYRDDFPDTDNTNWLKNIYLARDGNKVKLWSQPVHLTRLHP